MLVSLADYSAMNVRKVKKLAIAVVVLAGFGAIGSFHAGHIVWPQLVSSLILGLVGIGFLIFAMVRRRHSPHRSPDAH
jgi:CBS-domain-containing membrane protein